MTKRLVALLLFAAAAPVLGQSLEPGEWEFTSTQSLPSMPNARSMTFTQCIKKEDAQNPEKLAAQAEKSGCKVTETKKSGDSVSWEMECPKMNMRGVGTARIGRGTMESQMTMSGEMKGQKYEMTTRTTARRLGPCKAGNSE